MENGDRKERGFVSTSYALNVPRSDKLIKPVVAQSFEETFEIALDFLAFNPMQK